MLKRTIQLIFLLVGGAAGVLFIPSLFEAFSFQPHRWIDNPYTAAAIGVIIFGILSMFLATPTVRLIQWVENQLLKAPIFDLIFGTLGLVIGLFVAFLISFAFSSIEIRFITSVLPIVLSVFLGYLGFQVGFQKREELMASVFQWKTAERETIDKKGKKKSERTATKKVLDTSVIIDGRIADVATTGFLEGVLIVPQFVLTELQHIADSSDSLKRTKGRRGLDILKLLQENERITVEITNKDYESIPEVDLKLVRLAKDVEGSVVTTDFNLNKVADLHGVEVLNMNDLSNAVKPIVIPGEKMHLYVIKQGKEHNQGIAYLEDGTMIVVEEGKRYIGQSIDTVVTSVLQTSAGRMIFVRPLKEE